jgi:hypothetical protein
MIRKLTALAVLAVAAAGCSEAAPGRIRLLGDVDEKLAFTAARDVMTMYFEIEPADPDTREIKCRPKMTGDVRERLLGGSPTRQVAQLAIIRTEGQLAAQVSVAVQQQGAAVHRTVHGTDSYDSVPHQTPSEIDAATTTEQNETWNTVRYDYELERKILDDIYRQLHPQKD